MQEHARTDPGPAAKGPAANGRVPRRVPPGSPDLVAAALLTLVAVTVLYDTLHYPDSVSPGAPGPAAFPRLLAMLLLVLCGWLAVRAWHDNTARAPTRGRPAWSRNLTALGLMAAFVLVAERTDFFLSMAALVASLMFLLGEPPARTAATALLFAGFVYAAFYWLFGVPFPTVF